MVSPNFSVMFTVETAGSLAAWTGAVLSEHIKSKPHVYMLLVWLVVSGLSIVYANTRNTGRRDRGVARTHAVDVLFSSTLRALVLDSTSRGTQIKPQ